MASVALDLNSGKATKVDGATWFTIAGNTIEKAVTGDGADTLLGNSLANTLHGMRGNDILNGGKGKDTLLGGSGKDNFVFDAALKAANVDHVGDFLHAKDKLRLDDDVFKALDAGKLAASAFHSARNADEAKDAADRIVYDTRSGELRYDPDGKGGKAAILFAILDGSPTPSAPRTSSSSLRTVRTKMLRIVHGAPSSRGSAGDDRPLEGRGICFALPPYAPRRHGRACPRLVPAIHDFALPQRPQKVVDGRHEAGHDDVGCWGEEAVVPAAEPGPRAGRGGGAPAETEGDSRAATDA